MIHFVDIQPPLGRATNFPKQKICSNVKQNKRYCNRFYYQLAFLSKAPNGEVAGHKHNQPREDDMQLEGSRWRDRFLPVLATVGAFALAGGAVTAQPLSEQWLSGALDPQMPEFTYEGEPITVDIAHFLAPNVPITTILERAGERLEAETGGRMNIRVFYNNSLHDAQRGGFEGVAGGISDLSTCYSWINPGGFNLQLGLQLPFLFERSTVASHAIMQLYGQYLREDYENQGVLFARSTSTQPQQIITTGDPILTFADLAGKRMMASGDLATNITTALGAVPVPLTVAEYYSGFQQGVVDLMVIHDAGLKLFRFYELATSRTIVNLWANPIEYCMNADFFYGLPDDLQQAFHIWLMRLNHAEAELYFDNVSAEGRAELESRNIPTYELSAEDNAALVAAAQPIVDAWIAEQEAEGRPATEFLDALRAKVAELDQLTDDELFMLTYTQPYPGLVD
jgi:TRAP-type transport system periplasmic protein